MAYRLALPPNLSRVHNVFLVLTLRKYVFDPSHVVDFASLELQEDLSFEEHPVQILAREVKKLRNCEIPYVKVFWSNHEERECSDPSPRVAFPVISGVKHLLLVCWARNASNGCVRWTQ